MKYKKIGDVLILDKNHDYDDFESLSKKHKVKTIMKIDHIQGTKRSQFIKFFMVIKQKQSTKKTGVCLSWI